jgi:hypothetical protein
MATHERSHSATVLWLLAAAIPFVVATTRCKPRAPTQAAAVAPVTPVAPVRAVANVKHIMSGLIDPGADVVWESVGGDDHHQSGHRGAQAADG